MSQKPSTDFSAIYMTKKLPDGTILAFNRKYQFIKELNAATYEELRGTHIKTNEWPEYQGGTGHDKARVLGTAEWWE